MSTTAGGATGSKDYSTKPIIVEHAGGEPKAAAAPPLTTGNPGGGEPKAAAPPPTTGNNPGGGEPKAAAPPPATTGNLDGGAPPTMGFLDKSLGTVANLSKLLPTGTTLAFQTMAPAFTKGGECEDHDVNFAFTWGLISFLTVLCAALSFTDSITDKKGVTYYGVATPTGFKLFNQQKLRRLDLAGHQRRSMRMNWLDFLHAGVSAAVFVALAFCDAGVQRCLVKQDSQPWKDFLNHLPLAVGFLASFVLIVYPSRRKGIGDVGIPEADDDTIHKKRWRFDKSMVTVAGLSKLLPAGTTLAFQTMAPSFTRGGQCQRHGVNFGFTWGLIGFLTVLCAALSFTDSITDEHGVTYYGVATPRGLRLFDRHPTREGEDEWEELKRRRRIKQRDVLHAVLSAAVFVAIAFCDGGVQGCLLPEESRQWREFTSLLPLAVGFVASFVFIIFPSTRKGIGHEGAWTPDRIDEVKKDESSNGAAATTTTTSITTTTTTTTTKTWKKSSGNTQVAPSSSAREEQHGSAPV